ncbi:hypothetical protein [Massilia mucilaginosa]|nr:hypothetical protein [Massilia mucilaginosa]
MIERNRANLASIFCSTPGFIECAAPHRLGRSIRVYLGAAATQN